MDAPKLSIFNKIIQRFNSENKITSINLFLRGLSLGGKFIFLILLAKHLTDYQLGEWGIFTTSISLALYLIGLDFYTYSARTILEYPIEERSRLLRDQLVFYGISYIIIFPFISLLFVFGVIELQFILFFYIILVFEHLAQESYRTFVVFSKPIYANIILFLRTGLWTYLLLGAWFIGFDDLKTVKSALVFWIFGGASALIMSIFFISKIPLKSVKGVPINWQWIKEGVRVSLIYFSATICFKIIEFSDRYFIDFWHSKEMVGIYTFYANMANMIEIFVQTTTIIIFSPKLIDTFHKNQFLYKQTFQKFAKNLLKFNLLALLILAIIMYPLMKWVIDKQSYLDHISSFYLLCLSELVFNVSLIFHYILYVRKHDHSVIKATIASAFVNILLNFLFIPKFGINGAAFSTLLTFILLVFAKAYYTRKTFEGKNIIYFRFLKSIKKN